MFRRVFIDVRHGRSVGSLEMKWSFMTVSIPLWDTIFQRLKNRILFVALLPVRRNKKKPFSFRLIQSCTQIVANCHARRLSTDDSCVMCIMINVTDLSQ